MFINVEYKAVYFVKLINKRQKRNKIKINNFSIEFVKPKLFMKMIKWINNYLINF